MTKPDTHLLDGAIALLKGNGTAKRPARKAQVELVMYVDHRNGLYSITSNGKPIVVDMRFLRNEDPTNDMGARAAKLRAMGKTVTTQVF